MRLPPLLLATPVLAGLPAAALADGLREGAIGLVASYGPSFLGSDEDRAGATPAWYLRWGRVSISSAAGFITRSQDDVVRGLGVDLVQREELKVSLSLRLDGGRSESVSGALAGVGGVRKTIRARLAARRGFELAGGRWQGTFAWNIDALDRGGGSLFEAVLQREWPLPGDATLYAGGALTWGTHRYQQSWFGITPEQSQRSGYAVYFPGSGWRDASLFTRVHVDLGSRWSTMAGVGYSRLLGPSADSPLARQRGGGSVSVGVAWRF